MGDDQTHQIAREAKAAFAFRDVPVVEVVGAADLVGIRSTAALDAHRVERGDITLLWSIDNDRLTGVLDADDVRSVILQTEESIDELAVDFVGTFEMDMPAEAYRFVIDAEGDTWATSWLN